MHEDKPTEGEIREAESHAAMLEIIDELEQYAELCDDDYGEYCRGLCQIYSVATHCASSASFRDSLEKEIKAQLTVFKEATKIVTRERTYTHTYDELVWLDE